jgi:ubiquinone/menaquinone biosynthesis C-methylase UbiE
MQKAVRKVLRAVADYDPDYYDMYANANEAFFAQLYVERILQRVEAAGIRPPATMLEAGCQAGRLVVPFAKLGFTVTGIDTSGYALRRAQEHVREAGVRATFVRGDLITVLTEHPEWRFDLVVCAEVVYLSPRYRQMLDVLAGAVRPGGLLCVSHRPRSYYLVEALRQYDVETATAVLERGEGAFRDSAYYNWQTPEGLRALYEAMGLQSITLHPIDRVAWLCGMDVSRLTPIQQEQVRELERRWPGDEPGGRYVLVVASRPHGLPS